MEILSEKTVAQIVADDYRSADVFKKYGIDFCCGGKVTLKDICHKKNIAFEALSADLKNAADETTEVLSFNDWELDKLAHYIVDKHHTYVTQNLELIQQYADKVALVHGQHRPEVKQIALLFAEAAKELRAHMKKEELVLFPYIHQLAAAKRYHEGVRRPVFGTVRNPVGMMEVEHESVGDILHQIAELSDQYTPPAEACNTYRVLYAKLREFEADLHTHVHLENNILFPKAIALEEPILKSFSNTVSGL